MKTSGAETWGFIHFGKSRIDTISYYFTIEKTATIIHTDGNQPDLRMVFNMADATITALFEMKGKNGKAAVEICLSNFHETVNDSIVSKEGHTLSELN